MWYDRGIVAIASGRVADSAGLLAQSNPSAAAFEGVVILAAVVAVMMVVLFMALQVRKRWTRRDSVVEPPFSLDAIRRMRDRGELSEGEYDSLRRRIIERAAQ